MEYVFLEQLVQLKNKPTKDTVFAIAPTKSTFIYTDKYNVCQEGKDGNNIMYYASPTPLCGNGVNQYNPCFIMAVLSTLQSADKREILQRVQLPKVLFETHPDVRRSMTLNAMRMSTELFALGSQRVYQLAQQRLQANQPDVVHDLLVYLMHAILDVRQEYTQEKALRADSIAAYLGIDPAKVLSLMRHHQDDDRALAASLQHGEAGKLQRQLDVAELVKHQIALLTPHQQSARATESELQQIIATVLQLWKEH